MPAEAKTEVAQNPGRAKVLALEDELAKLPQMDLEVNHYFSDGLYVRELMIPAGVVLTGKVHKRDHINFLMKGEISVMTDDGVKRLEAPMIIPATKGIKRVGFAHTDTIWVTAHATTATDVETVEDELVEIERPHIIEASKQQKVIK